MRRSSLPRGAPLAPIRLRRRLPVQPVINNKLAQPPSPPRQRSSSRDLRLASPSLDHPQQIVRRQRQPRTGQTTPPAPSAQFWVCSPAKIGSPRTGLADGGGQRSLAP